MKYTYSSAIKRVAKFGDADCTESGFARRDRAVKVVYNSAAPLCETDPDSSPNYSGYGLREYLFEQPGWRGNETPEEIAREWDALNKKKR